MSDLEDAEFKLQVTFPEHEELELRRKALLGGEDYNQYEDVDDDSGLAVTTNSYRLRLAANRNCGLSLEQRELQAERKFQVIKDRVL